MRHPFSLTPNQSRKTAFWCFFAATLLWMIVMQVAGAPLTTPAAPSGIVSYELAGSTDQVRLILDSWNPQARLYAALNLGLDYLFMLLYSTTLALGCLWAGETLRQRVWPLGGWGNGLAWGQSGAAVLDAFENLALIVILLGGLSSPWPELARISALGKFVLIFLGFVYISFGLVAYWFRKPVK